MYSATAESPQHPGYKRYRMFEKEIASGNPNYAIIRYDYKDFSNLKSHSGKPFKEQVPDWKTITNHKRMFTRAHSLREDHGLWARETAGWYSEEALGRCVRAGLALGTEVEVGRGESLKSNVQSPKSLEGEEVVNLDKVFYFLGVDPAPAKTRKADDGGLAALRVRPKPGLGHEAGANASDWLAEFVWAYRVRGEMNRPLDDGIFLADTVRHWAGLIHWKHLAFGFNGVCIDTQAGGGGGLIVADLNKTKQIILGAETTVTPIASLEDSSVAVAAFILTCFRRRDPGIAALWPILQGDDNLIDALHMKFQEAVEHALVLFPKPFNERAAAETREWPKEKKWALKTLDAARKQLENIQVVTKDDGTWALTSHGAKQFVAGGKKDLAYACLMAYVRFLVWLKLQEMDWTAGGGSETGIFVIG